MPPADDGQDAQPGNEDGSTRAGGSPTATAFVASIGKEEFVEGLVRTGFTVAHELGPALFDFLDTSGSGVVGPDEFARLEEITVPCASRKLVALYDFLLQQHGTIDEAFA